MFFLVHIIYIECIVCPDWGFQVGDKPNIWRWQLPTSKAICLGPHGVCVIYAKEKGE